MLEKTNQIRKLLEDNYLELIASDKTKPTDINGICYDGIIDEATFEKNNPRIIFLLKETNGNDSSGKQPKKLDDWDYRSWLQYQQAYGEPNETLGSNNLYKTFINICMWIDVFYNIVEDKSISYTDYIRQGYMEKEKLRKNLLKTAIVNLKKTWGKGTTNWRNLNEYLENETVKSVLKKQIDIINSNYVVCGGREVFDFAKQIFNGEEQTLLISNELNINYFKTDNNVVLNFYHPACRKNREFLYNYSHSVFSKIISQYKDKNE